jgi:hypothetical protein
MTIFVILADQRLQVNPFSLRRGVIIWDGPRLLVGEHSWPRSIKNGQQIGTERKISAL